MAEMVKKFDVQAPQITKWKKQLLESTGNAYDKGDKFIEDNEKPFGSYMPESVSDEELELIKLIDQLNLERPFYGIRRIKEWLWDNHGLAVNRKRIR